MRKDRFNARMRPAVPRSITPLWLLAQVHGRQSCRRLLALRRQSRLQSALIAAFLGGYFFLSFWLFWKGLHFISSFPGLGTLMTERLLYLLFACLFVLLWFSSLVICHTNLFRHRETHFLLSLPIDHNHIFQWKFLESTLLASWAFIFLAAPMLLAYGLNQQVQWHFYLSMPCLLGWFIVLPAAGGAWGAIQIARHLDRRNFQWAAFLSLVALVVLAILFFQPQTITDESLEIRVQEVLDRLLLKTRFAQFPWLPSYWLCASLMNWAEGSLAGAVFFGMVLLSNALFFGFLTLTASGRSFYAGTSAVQSRSKALTGRRPPSAPDDGQCPIAIPAGWMERAVGLFPWLKPEGRALVVKDLRVFWRDTTQWGQTLVLFGLLCVYFLNLSHFRHQFQNSFWINLVSYLNLLACTLNLATITTRFVFPQFSQEGKRLWIIGLAPVGIHTIIKYKFAMAVTASLAVTAMLMSLSCYMLRMPWMRTIFFAITGAVMAFALSGMALGLGTLYPNFKEENPSKIVSGFGGTLCLILSFAYILGSVSWLALTFAWGRGETLWGLRQGLAGLVFLLWSGLLGWFPYRLGLKKLQNIEWVSTP